MKRLICACIVVALAAFAVNAADVEYVGTKQGFTTLYEVRDSVDALAAGGTLTNTLTVTGAITGSSTITVAGVGAFSTNVTVAGDLTVTGAMTASSTNYSGDLTVAGDMTVNSNMTVSGTSITLEGLKTANAGYYIVDANGTGANTNVLFSIGTSFTIGDDADGTLIETNAATAAEFSIGILINGDRYNILLEKP